MTARDLFEAIGKVDEELIEDADAPAQPHRPKLLPLRRLIPVAACLCLAVGAVLAWRLSGPSMTGGLTDARPEAAQAAPAQGQEDTASEGDSQQNSSQGTARDSVTAAIPEELAQAITPVVSGNGTDDGPVLATSAEELVGDTAPADPPETMTLYRGTLADPSLDEAGMRQTMEQVLTALGQDPALADGAELSYGVSEDEVAQRDAIADSLWQKFGPGSALTFWKSLAWLELTLPDGSTLTVANDRAITLDPPEDTDGLRPMTAADREANADLLAALGGFDTDTVAGASHSWTDGTAGDPVLELRRSTGPGRLTGKVDGDGRLVGFAITGAAQAQAAGNYPVISQEIARQLLESGCYLNAAYREIPPTDGTIVDARLCYPDGTSLYYTPVWRFLVGFGTPDADLYPTTDPDTGQALHAYREYYVPATPLDTLTALVTDPAGD